MALEVNNQNLLQNAQFQQFVDFAEAAVKAGGALIVLSMQDFGNADAIANLKQGGGVERHGRLGGFFAKMFRSSATQASNFANKHADSETSCHENEGSAY